MVRCNVIFGFNTAWKQHGTYIFHRLDKSPPPQVIRDKGPRIPMFVVILLMHDIKCLPAHECIAGGFLLAWCPRIVGMQVAHWPCLHKKPCKTSPSWSLLYAWGHNTPDLQAVLPSLPGPFYSPTDWASLATCWLTAVLYCIRSYRHNRVPVHWGFCRLCFQSLQHKLISGSWHWLNKWLTAQKSLHTEAMFFISPFKAQLKRINELGKVNPLLTSSHPMSVQCKLALITGGGRAVGNLTISVPLSCWSLLLLLLKKNLINLVYPIDCRPYNFHAKQLV